MKFSEAVLLGSTLLHPIPYNRNNGRGEGCAIGMAEESGGVRRAEESWPWLAKLAGPTDKYPCGCLTHYPSSMGIETYSLLERLYAARVAHIFNEHVCKDKTWTLEQLVDWIRSVEPEEVAIAEQKAEEAVSV